MRCHNKIIFLRCVDVRLVSSVLLGLLNSRLDFSLLGLGCFVGLLVDSALPWKCGGVLVLVWVALCILGLDSLYCNWFPYSMGLGPVVPASPLPVVWL